MEKKLQLIIVVVAILVIGSLEAIALSRGLDGTYFALVIAAIAGLAGYKLPGIIQKLKK